MAFNKRLWKGRQGTGLNKFSINGATPVTVINQPDSVTEQGDALSAGNLNDLEQRIYDAFDDIADGTQIVGKATSDALGNVIDQTYETKADASDLKDAIQFNRRRIENLEQKSGSVVDVDYPEYSVTGEVPTGKAKNAIVSKLRGVSVAHNQLNDYSQYSDYGNAVYKIEYNGYQAKLTVLSVPQTTYYNTSHPYMKVEGLNPDHKILITGTEKRGTVAKITERRYMADGTSQFGSFAQRMITGITGLLEYTDITASSVANDVCSLEDCFVYDLTQALGPSVADYLYSIEQATAGAGVALFRALESAQDNSAETGRLVSTMYESVGSRGKNLVQSLINGYFANTDFVTSGSSSVFKSVKLWLDAGTYTLSTSIAVNVVRLIADGVLNENPASNVTSYTFTTTTTGWVGLSMRDKTSSDTPWADSTTVQVERGSTATAYSPYMTDSLPLPESVTLRGILKVVNNNLVVDGDEYDLEKGEIDRNYGIVDLGSLTWSKASNWGQQGVTLFYATLESTNRGIDDAICANYEVLPRSINNNLPDKCMMLGSSYISSHITTVGIADNSYSDANTFKTAMNGVYLVYKLATPTSDSPIDPVLDPTIQIEGGGTLSTEQTNDPAIVSALEMTYLTI